MGEGWWACRVGIVFAWKHGDWVGGVLQFWWWRWRAGGRREHVREVARDPCVDLRSVPLLRVGMEHPQLLVRRWRG